MRLVVVTPIKTPYRGRILEPPGQKHRHQSTRPLLRRKQTGSTLDKPKSTAIPAYRPQWMEPRTRQRQRRILILESLCHK